MSGLGASGVLQPHSPVCHFCLLLVIQFWTSYQTLALNTLSNRICRIIKYNYTHKLFGTLPEPQSEVSAATVILNEPTTTTHATQDSPNQS